MGLALSIWLTLDNVQVYQSPDCGQILGPFGRACLPAFVCLFLIIKGTCELVIGIGGGGGDKLSFSLGVHAAVLSSPCTRALTPSFRRPSGHVHHVRRLVLAARASAHRRHRRHRLIGQNPRAQVKRWGEKRRGTESSRAWVHWGSLLLLLNSNGWMDGTQHASIV